MDRISCDVCLDLMALVRDGAASEGSREAVEEHVKDCEACRSVFEGAAAPEAGGEKALRKAVQRVKKTFAVAAVVFVLMGICLCELVFRGSSVVFLVVVLLIRWLLTVGAGEGRNWRTVAKRTAALALAAALIVGLLALGNALLGNPVSKKVATLAAQAYLDGMGLECGAYIGEVSHDSKRGMYDFKVLSENSRDTWFTIMVRPDGTVRSDTYYHVVTGYNTAQRLETEYWQLAAPALGQLNLAYGDSVTWFTELKIEQREWQKEYIYQFFLDGELLVPDGEYDILQVGAEAGALTVRVEDDEVSARKAAELLLEVRRVMDAAEAPFATVDLILQYPRPEDGSQRKAGCVEVRDFRYEEIYEEGLVPRIMERIPEE